MKLVEEAYQQHHDIVEAVARKAYYHCRSTFQHEGYDVDDLVSELHLAFVEVVLKHDPDRSPIRPYLRQQLTFRMLGLMRSLVTRQTDVSMHRCPEMVDRLCYYDTSELSYDADLVVRLALVEGEVQRLGGSWHIRARARIVGALHNQLSWDRFRIGKAIKEVENHVNANSTAAVSEEEYCYA